MSRLGLLAARPSCSCWALLSEEQQCDHSTGRIWAFCSQTSAEAEWTEVGDPDLSWPAIIFIFVFWNRHWFCSQSHHDKFSMAVYSREPSLACGWMRWSARSLATPMILWFCDNQAESSSLNCFHDFGDENMSLLCLILDAQKCSFLSSAGSVSHRRRLSKEFSCSIYRPVCQSNREDTCGSCLNLYGNFYL